MTKARRIVAFNEVLTLPAGWIILLWLLLGAIVIPVAQAQNDSTYLSSDLKTATIYFVIPTGGHKIGVLKEELNRLSDNREKARIAQMIETEQMEADSFSRALIAAVEHNFTAADYDFIADTSVKSLVRNPENETKLIFLVRRSKTESGADALILHDLHMMPLRRPVPYYARLTGFISFVDALFGKTAYNWKDLDKVIHKWSERLQDFNSTGPDRRNYISSQR